MGLRGREAMWPCPKLGLLYVVLKLLPWQHWGPVYSIVRSVEFHFLFHFAIHVDVLTNLSKINWSAWQQQSDCKVWVSDHKIRYFLWQHRMIGGQIDNGSPQLKDVVDLTFFFCWGISLFIRMLKIQSFSSYLFENTTNLITEENDAHYREGSFNFEQLWSEQRSVHHHGVNLTTLQSRRSVLFFCWVEQCVS